MSALRLATLEDLDRLTHLVAGFHAESGIEQDEATRHEALVPLLQGSPHGAIWMIGPRSAPVGYIAVSFGWSIEFGGLDAFVDEFYVRERVRGRGMGSEAMMALARALAGQGIKAMNLEVDTDNQRARTLYERIGFSSRDRYHLMARIL
ncbi:GNAT family N-acetyltransferase [Aliiroseovarius crassostreae]|uniref:GNAT family N-acetyltransferase n=1 Tax=Aliiroseovarius crassostreae TaxID=154981 RepID=A0A9Q9HDN4_9RHOB|nr:GNAT family N-acetyltransferase [Aliiroseovarius crassostreae]UWP89975.1 GNAT family N-acetyltransferase [Aliiroseovarius crassostreae]UWP93134.1 GNAT family N-acetyltransferase [Aliiroseovarius crassostreae]UWP96269.1 GNAT family N-acetyltransferase [Aliiroseovarius crassostreae]UWP99429.1 GNAT family N-acetyltransferase [Aliiroseovarius crassostreae]UWQ02626.1 GNAT family N-acetyltransferase [Aliiroseovarius crassostreae]